MSPVMDIGGNGKFNVLPPTPTLTIHPIPILHHGKIFPSDPFSSSGTHLLTNLVVLYL